MTYDPAAGAANAMGDPTPQDEVDAIQERVDYLNSQLIDLAGLKKLPPPVPLVEGYLWKNTLTWIGGKPGHYKTFLGVELACCVGTGTPWHGRKVTKGRVIYLIAEGVQGMAQRFEAWTEYHKIDVTGVMFLPISLRLGDPNSVDSAAFAVLIRDYQADLVIVDTQARCTVGRDENSSRDMGEFVETLSMLRLQNSATMLVLHHEPRNATNLRGSIALEGGADTILRTVKEGDLVTVETSKQKDAPELEPFELRIEPVEKSIVLVEPDPGGPRSTSTNENKILDILLNWPGFEASGGDLIEPMAPLNKATVYRTLNSLERKGKVVMRKSGNAKYFSIPLLHRPRPHGV